MAAVAYERPTPTALELSEGANDLLYEVLMLSNTAGLLEDDSQWNKDWGWQSKTLYMATLESFLTHARSLMDFVCPPSDWETQATNARGIFAADYCTQPWKRQPWPTLREEHKRISREIQHLTFDRPTVGRNWKYVELLNRLKERLLSFLGDADGLSAHIRDQMRGILVDRVRVSVADTGEPGMAISVPALTALSAGGVSGATSSMIDPAQIKKSGECSE